MHKGLSKILVTGGAGFMGSEFVRFLTRDCPESLRQLRGIHPERSEGPSKLRGLSLVVIDKLTYAGDLERLNDIKGRYKFYKADICNRKQIEFIFGKEKPDVVLNFAAETHVDRSIRDAAPFLETNIRGTQVLLDVSMKYQIKRFIQISSDEIYGEIKKGSFSEDSPLRPNSPYAASKAAADLLVKAYMRTYGFPAIIVRPCNNYGPWQYPEKLIPLAILKILRKEKIPVYADGKNVREWLFVSDCVEGIFKILQKGKLGEIYNLGSGEEKQNIEAVKLILKNLQAPQSMIQFVKDRPGHDIRYKLNSQKLWRKIGWKPKVEFTEGIKITVQWCLEHKDWLLSKWTDIAGLYRVPSG
jgi:dTDP-glucose 4,6-dehydratase